MALPELTNFSLVGGTALALKFGHRISVDLDLFSSEPFDQELVLNALSKEFGSNFLYEGRNVKFGIFCYISNIKVDIVHYPHPAIAPIENTQRIRLYSTEDIVAMKVNAILGRGVKKDFYDIYELLSVYSIQQFIDAYYEKYPRQMLLISIPEALTYFADAEETEAPISLKGQTWEKVKQQIQKAVNEYLK